MAGSIPQHFITELLSRVDIVDIIDRAVSLKKAGKDFKACCPFHEEKTPSFTVSQDKQFYHCFGCGAHGSAISFLMDYHNMGFVEAIEELATGANIEIPREAGDFKKVQRHDDSYQQMELVAQYFCQQLQNAPNAHRVTGYLKERGISNKIAKEFELGSAPPGWSNLLNALGTSSEAKQQLLQTGMIVEKNAGDYHDRFRDRLMFPIRNQRGKIVGFGGRLFAEGQPKYLNSPETAIFQKGHELYGLFQAKQYIKDLQCSYIVEGYMDVLSLAQHGVRNVVAALGTALTADHLQKLLRICNRIILCLDGDSAGKKGAWRAMETILPLLKEGRQVYFMFIPDGDDPDTYIQKHGAENFLNQQHLMSLSDYLVNEFKQDTALDNREEVGRLVDGIAPLIAKLPAGALRELLIKDIAKLADMTVGVIKNLIDKEPSQSPRKKLPQHRVTTGGRPDKTRDRSLVASAITALLHNPELAIGIETDHLNGIETHGIDFLRELLSLIHTQPTISCAGILEHWRDSKYERHLKELSIKDNLFNEMDDLRENFLEIILKIGQDYSRQIRTQRVQSVRNKDDLRNLFPAPTTHGEEQK